MSRCNHGEIFSPQRTQRYAEEEFHRG